MTKKRNKVSGLKTNVPLPANIPGGTGIKPSPSKEWDIGPGDMEIIKLHKVKQMELVGVQKALSFMRHDYIVRETELMAEWKTTQEKCFNLMKKLKDNHQIIGEIAGFDLERNKIITR